MRILSYNIHKGIGNDRRYRLERVIDVIEHENPDLICLQEVDRHVRRSRFDDQPRRLADVFHPAANLFQLNVHLKRGGYGNLLLSRWRLLEKHQISLRLRTKKPRGAQLACIKTPEGRLNVVNLHLGLAEAERRWQVEHLLAHPLFRRMPNVPTVILGDTNDWRDNLRRLFAEHGFDLATQPVSRFRTFPSYLAIGALDKAFVRGGVRVKHAYVPRHDLARRASDHLPVVLDVHLET